MEDDDDDGKNDVDYGSDKGIVSKLVWLMRLIKADEDDDGNDASDDTAAVIEDKKWDDDDTNADEEES